MADAPANQRIAIVVASYAVPNTSPKSRCARYASARPFADPPARSAPEGIRIVVTSELPISSSSS
jgi:hypothetical protein